MGNDSLKQLTTEASRRLEDVEARMGASIQNINSDFGLNGRFNSNRRVIAVYMAIRANYAEACEGIGQLFAVALREGQEWQSLVNALTIVLNDFWTHIEAINENGYVKHHREAGEKIQPTWLDFLAWREREVKLALEKHLPEPLETATVKQLKNATDDNWRGLFERADEMDLHAIIEGQRVMAGAIVKDRAKAELRRRDTLLREADIARQEEHAEKLSKREMFAGVIGVVLGAVLAWALGLTSC